jgi:hypothetical protein
MKNKSGKCKLFSTIPSENDEDKICCLAVDENDNVFILVQNNIRRCKLLIFDVNGNLKTERYLEHTAFIGAKICVTKDGLIVIYHIYDRAIYIYDRTNAGKDYKFFVPFQDKRCTFVSSLAVSNKDDIILAFTSYDYQLLIYVLTMDGQLKRRVEVPVSRYFNYICALNVVFNDVNEAIIVSVSQAGATNTDDNDDLANIGISKQHEHTRILTFSLNTGELLRQFEIQGHYKRLMSHRNGHIVLDDDDNAIILQT